MTINDIPPMSVLSVVVFALELFGTLALVGAAAGAAVAAILNMGDDLTDRGLIGRRHP